MCTTGLCNAIYLLTLCIFGWIGTGILITMRGRKLQGNKTFLNPLLSWVQHSVVNEVINPLNCFKGEVIKPVLGNLFTMARNWNENVGSKYGIIKAF